MIYQINQLHETDPPVLICPRNSPGYKERVGLLTCSKELEICPLVSQINPLSLITYYSCILYISFITLPTPASCKTCLSFRFTHQNLYVFLYSPIPPTPFANV